MILQTREEINRDLGKTTSSQIETGSYEAIRDDGSVKDRIFRGLNDNFERAVE
ncbi:MAG: hypothetical protein GY845_25235 [Planctomycetes bacterium]|nr:hypothetical protein [Planctomycetota bacterium]